MRRALSRLATDTTPPRPRNRKWKLAGVERGYTAIVASVGGGAGSFSVGPHCFRVVSSSCSRQPPCGLAGRLSCHQRFRFGSSQGTRSPLDPPSLKVASQPVPPYHSSFGEFCRWTLFGSSQSLGGVIRSRSPDSVLHPTASCTALSRHLTQGQR